MPSSASAATCPRSLRNGEQNNNSNFPTSSVLSEKSMEGMLSNGMACCCKEVALWKARHNEETPESRSQASFPIITAACSLLSANVASRGGRDFNQVAKLVLISLKKCYQAV